MDSRKEIFNQMEADKIRVSYTGPFDGSILSVMAKNIEFSLSSNPSVNKRMFKIFLELAQNISFYSAEKNIDNYNQGVGTLTIKEFENYFLFATGNIIEHKDAEIVIGRCEKINLLDRKELREYKREARKRAHSKIGGGNIGLIQVALTSRNKLQYKTIPLEDGESYYIIAAKIDKN
ncbi:MAG: SiaB family protein kinase [Bacteroidota bacterium]|nr:SiaB family protein kinase [Bacteroidota bacterium]